MRGEKTLTSTSSSSSSRFQSFCSHETDIHVLARFMTSNFFCGQVMHGQKTKKNKHKKPLLTRLMIHGPVVYSGVQNEFPVQCVQYYDVRQVTSVQCKM